MLNLIQWVLAVVDGIERIVCIAAAKKIEEQQTEIVVLKTMVDVAQQELLDNQNGEKNVY